jgi:hypothetical protein
VFHQGLSAFFSPTLAALVRLCPIDGPFSKATLEALRFAITPEPSEAICRAVPLMVTAVLTAMTSNVPLSYRVSDQIFSRFPESTRMATTEISSILAIKDCVEAFIFGHEYGHVISEYNLSQTTLVTRGFVKC